MIQDNQNPTDSKKIKDFHVPETSEFLSTSISRNSVSREKGTTANSFEISLCSYCNCMTKSVQVEPFVFFCLKCGHDKMLGDVLQHKAKTKLNNVNPLVEQVAKQFIDLETEKIKSEEREKIKTALNKCFLRSKNKWTDKQIKDFLYQELELKENDN